MAATRNLIIVHQHGRQDVADFYAIAERMASRAPDIAVFIAENERIMARVRKAAATRPTLVFSPGPLGVFRPSRGRVFAGRPMPKLDEMRRLAAGGIPVPAFAELRPDTVLREDLFGSHVILKPSFPMASNARGQLLMRREAVRYRPPSDYPPGHFGRLGPMVVQRFVDTGLFPAQYRVLTLFGRPLYALSWRSTIPRAPLDSPDEVLAASRVTAMGTDFTGGYAFDADVLGLASRVHAALPDIPLQGCDLIREAGSGTLFVLEVNPGGNTWHFSSGVPVVAESEARRKDQFDAWSVAAEVLAEKTRALAE
jgi:hypothetical protein